MSPLQRHDQTDFDGSGSEGVGRVPVLVGFLNLECPGRRVGSTDHRREVGIALGCSGGTDISTETDPFADVFNLWLADILATGPGCGTNALIASPFISAAGNTSGWTRVSYDLTPYAGQVICLAFELRTNFFAESNLFLDDISFRDAP